MVKVAAVEGDEVDQVKMEKNDGLRRPQITNRRKKKIKEMPGYYACW